MSLVRLSYNANDLYLDIGTGLDDLLGGLIRILLEVLLEESSEFGDLGAEAVLALAPCIFGIEKFRWDTVAGFWDCEVECLVILVLDLGELAGVDGVEDGTGVFQSVDVSYLLHEVRNRTTYGQRLPPVVAPAPTHPVFNNQAFALWCSIFSANILAYLIGCKAKKG